MYIFHRVVHENLVYDRKVKLAKSQRHPANTEKRIFENVRGGGIGPPGQIGLRST